MYISLQNSFTTTVKIIGVEKSIGKSVFQAPFRILKTYHSQYQFDGKYTPSCPEKSTWCPFGPSAAAGVGVVRRGVSSLAAMAVGSIGLRKPCTGVDL